MTSNVVVGTDVDSVNRAIRCLRSNPLYHMSCSSMELFHSNLLAWLCSEYHELALLLFDGFMYKGEGESVEIVREKLHIDLIVYAEGYRPLVVENKVKSLAEVGQLDRYSPLAKRLGADLLLLSLAPPPWVLGLDGPREPWPYLSYSELKSRLERGAGLVKEPFHHELLTKYVELLSGLQAIHSYSEIRSDEEDLWRRELGQALRSVRMHHFFYKWRAKQIEVRLRRMLNEQWPGHDLSVNSGFTQMGGAVGVVSVYRGDIGFQIQGEDFRLCLLCSGIEKQSSKEAHWKKLRSHADSFIQANPGRWFDFSIMDEVLGASLAPSQGLDERWKVFSPHFVYRHRRMTNRNDQPLPTVDSVLRLAKAYISKMLPEKDSKANDF